MALDLVTHARTPDAAPWNKRRNAGGTRTNSGRTSYEVDRDRVIHCTTFRELQYKTQVQSLLTQKASKVFRTRLNHVLEVAQIGRGLAQLVGADEALTEAVALAHDLGHPPFGHAGERALRDALHARGREGWNANIHSLEVVDRVEVASPSYRGLNLTFAVREGIARHSTPFDEPVSFGEFASTPNGGIECQIVDVADVFAYLSHDLDDAIAGEYLSFGDVIDLAIIRELVEQAEEEWDSAAAPAWPEAERGVLVRKRVVAGLISRLINNTAATTKDVLGDRAVDSASAVREATNRVVSPDEEHEALVQDLLAVLTRLYYRSGRIAGADDAAQLLMTDLLDRLVESPATIPDRFRGDDLVIDAATYLASLNDFAAADLAKSLGIRLPAA